MVSVYVADGSMMCVHSMGVVCKCVCSAGGTFASSKFIRCCMCKLVVVPLHCPTPSNGGPVRRSEVHTGKKPKN